MKQIRQSRASSITFSSESFFFGVETEPCGTDCVLKQKWSLWELNLEEKQAILVKFECAKYQTKIQNAVSSTTIEENDQNLHQFF